MLSICEKPELKVDELGRPVPLCELFDENDSTKNKMDKLVNVLKASDLDGCITGSYFLPEFDPDGWGTKPDVDVFVYSEIELHRAIGFARALGMTPGEGGERSKEQEEWKLNRLNTSGLNYKTGITTCKFNYDGVILNITHKRRKEHDRWYPIMSAPDVLQSFDMSIVMQGYDIKHHVHYDMRIGNAMVAVPNPLRSQDCMLWTVAKWVRQFDRVVKYYNRGFDTRPMAKFYLDMIDECIGAGCLFDSEESQEMFTEYSCEFAEKRDRIAAWIEEHEED